MHVHAHASHGFRCHVHVHVRVGNAYMIMTSESLCIVRRGSNFIQLQIYIIPVIDHVHVHARSRRARRLVLASTLAVQR